ncbi:hypothetical protein HUZ36_04425 [Pseudoalteromonas sp. McH1-7]|uniref:hypothetical protein n=1 Tax=Pseudoalteromonas sp. McH1-7 TaxID=2745574 RepID=UPI00158FDD06|nr:hypothetical protein [Pseudoalteromonas sp. McH1-7]NUZ10018.1 hypothetical protein [Pseudoalteromonas sp. McH1-7]
METEIKRAILQLITLGTTPHPRVYVCINTYPTMQMVGVMVYLDPDFSEVSKTKTLLNKNIHINNVEALKELNEVNDQVQILCEQYLENEQVQVQPTPTSRSGFLSTLLQRLVEHKAVTNSPCSNRDVAA